MGMQDKSECWLSYIILLQVFKVCTMPDKERSPFQNAGEKSPLKVDESEQENAFIDFWKNVVTRAEYKLVEEDVPLLCYGVASTTCMGIGFETVFNEKIFEVLIKSEPLQMGRNHQIARQAKNPDFVALDNDLTNFACVFAQ